VKKLSRLKQTGGEGAAGSGRGHRAHAGSSTSTAAARGQYRSRVLTKAKDAKEKLDKDWAEARPAAKKEALAGHKAEAFHVLRGFVDAHAGTKQASTALGMMLGWTGDVRSEPRKPRTPAIRQGRRNGHLGRLQVA